MIAQSLGLKFQPDKDYSIDNRFHFLDKLRQGENRYAFNIMSGKHKDHWIQIFDFHYLTRSRDSDGKTKTTHHYLSFFMMHVEANFPELVICREGWFSKVAQFFGFDDIDFESAEFSKRFLVKSKDKKFAYDICNAQMIEYLLDNDDLNIEIERNCITLCFNRRLSPNQIEPKSAKAFRTPRAFPKLSGRVMEFKIVPLVFADPVFSSVVRGWDFRAQSIHVDLACCSMRVRVRSFDLAADGRIAAARLDPSILAARRRRSEMGDLARTHQFQFDGSP